MSPTRKGSISQRDLLPVMKVMIDAAMAPNSTAHRDIARSKLRVLREQTNWNTPYIFNNLGPRRCKHLASQGWPVPSKWLLTTWKRRPGVDKPNGPE